MRTPMICLGAAVLLIPVTFANTGEEKVALDKVPKPIMDAVNARFKDAKVQGAGKETEDGKLVYEVTIKVEGQSIDVTLTPDGEILMIEKKISAKVLPKAVTSSLEDKYPKATYRIVEEIFKVEKKEEKLEYYEVLLVTADKKRLEVQVSAEGKILNVEKKGTSKD